MNVIIGFIIGFLLGKFVKYIKSRIYSNKIEKPKTLNIGDSNDIIHVTSGMLILEINNISDVHKFDLSNMDDVVFYISSYNKYLYYKDKDFRYVKLDIPLY